MKQAFVLLFLIKNVFSANILFIAPLASPSHHLWNKVLSMELIKNGHNITMLTHDSEKELTKNFNVITMEGFYEVLLAQSVMQEFFSESNVLVTIKMVYDFIEFGCEYDMNTKGLEVLLNYPKDYKFDLIIYDITTAQCFYPLIERFHNPPVVAVTAFPLLQILLNSFGNHLYTSYMPYYSTTFANKMNFIERIKNFIYTYFEIFYRDYISASKQLKIAKKRFGESISTFADVERNISLLLSNNDPILDYPVALPPNIIPVGGLQVKPAKALPKDLQKIMDGAKHGVILFSLGTNVRSDQLKGNQRQALLGAFAKLPQIVLWKFETDNFEGLPANVVIRKWLPQNDILGHPNIKLFISHGGGLSTQEAMYHGVPIVGVPFMIDQYTNVGKMVRRKLATFLDHKNLTTENVYEAVTEILNNPVYRQNIKEVSRKYRDQPQTALERAVFWTEYVLRHGSAEHLVLPARDMPAYQTSNLDVAVAFVIGIILVYSVLLFIVTSCRLMFSLRRSDLKKKKTK